MWMLHWCLFCLLVHLTVGAMQSVARVRLDLTINSALFDVWTRWDHTAKRLAIWKSCFIPNLHKQTRKGDVWKGSDVASLPHLMAAGLLRLDVSQSSPSTLEWGWTTENMSEGKFEEVICSKDLWQKPFTFSRVEDTVGLGVAHVASLGLAVMLKSTGLTKIVSAPGGHGTGLHAVTDSWRGKSEKTEAYFVMMGFLKDSLQMKHLKGKSSSSLLTS